MSPFVQLFLPYTFFFIKDFCTSCFTLVGGSSPVLIFLHLIAPHSPSPPLPSTIMEAHQRGRYRALPLIATPLEQEGHGQHHGNPSEGSLDQEKDLKSSGSISVIAVIRHDSPKFREKEEASTIELFYDLFFVANLTSFTNIHAIDDRTSKSLSSLSFHQDIRMKKYKYIYIKSISTAILSYVGFFAILWFTWLQVVLYDVRFGVDSVFERICKLIHFGVMVSYAIVGTNFDPSNIAENYGTFRQLSVILVTSRILLIIQYGSVLFWIKGHKKAVTPIVIQIAIFAVGAAVSLGLLFSFKAENSGRPYFGWYAVAVFEAIVVFLSSSQWRVVSFKRTNLNERCGLLTLIILGEGIIVLSKAMNNVAKGENFSAAIIAQIISALLIIVIYAPFPGPFDCRIFFSLRPEKILTKKFLVSAIHSTSSTCSTSIKSTTNASAQSASNFGP